MQVQTTAGYIADYAAAEQITDPSFWRRVKAECMVKATPAPVLSLLLLSHPDFNSPTSHSLQAVPLVQIGAMPLPSVSRGPHTCPPQHHPQVST